MNITLKDLALQLSSGTIVLGGQQVAARAVSSREWSAIREAMPQPQPPLGPDPSKGSEAAWVPNEQDERYNARLEVWWPRVLAAGIAVAVGLDLDGLGGFTLALDPARRAVWAAAAADALTAQLTVGQINKAWSDVQALSASAAALDQAGKASGTTAAS